MFTQPTHVSPAIAFPQQAGINPWWCADNPNVDRSAPPPPRKVKAAKKKPVAKKMPKRR